MPGARTIGPLHAMPNGRADTHAGQTLFWSRPTSETTGSGSVVIHLDPRISGSLGTLGHELLLSFWAAAAGPSLNSSNRCGSVLQAWNRTLLPTSGHIPGQAISRSSGNFPRLISTPRVCSALSSKQLPLGNVVTAEPAATASLDVRPSRTTMLTPGTQSDSTSSSRPQTTTTPSTRTALVAACVSRHDAR